MTREAAAHAVVANAVAHGVAPGASLEVGDRTGVLWRDAVGSLAFDEPTRVSSDTLYDLASLTKPLATTAVTLALAAHGRLSLSDRVASHIPDWRGDDRHDVTVADLLEHCSGLPARLLEAPPRSRREFDHDIAQTPLEYRPRTRAIYSDLGFILLGHIAADVGRAGLDEQFDALCAASGVDQPLLFRPGRLRANTAPTLAMDEDERHGQRLSGEVHDNYAAALGGVAGHAGLFGTAAAVGQLARVWLRARLGESCGPPPFDGEWAARATGRSLVPGSSRALGWDTMLTTSSCGGRMSAQAFGHVGFTGTSVWIDPAQDRYFVLLTNRACGGGSLEAMRELRRSFHDACHEPA